jgi:hypothetical protein
MKDPTENKINSNERFVRWQNILREHVTFLNNLLLTISFGILGFIFSLLNNENFNPNCCQKIFLTFGVLTLLFSIIFGIVTTFSRLFDFRTTLNKIKSELNNESLTDYKILMKVFGKTTWCFLYLQIFTLLISTINITISLILIFNEKLF